MVKTNYLYHGWIGLRNVSLFSALLYFAITASTASAQAPSFEERVKFGPSNITIRDIAVGDINGDGLLDIATGRIGEQSVIYLNQAGSQLLSQSIPVGPNNAYTGDIALGDLNSDGLLDIVTGVDGGQSAIYLNQGGSLFSSQGIPFGPNNAYTGDIALGDLDSDGLLDIVMALDGGQSTIYLNQGGGRFSYQGIPFGPDNIDAPSIALGDLNGDGLLDIITGNWGPFGGQSAIYLNQGVEQFRIIPGIHLGPDNAYTGDIALGDLNSDGLLDIIAGISGIDDGGQSVIYLNQGGSRFPTQGIPFGPDNAYTEDIALGDLNSDGLLDIITGVDGGQSAIYLNQDGGRFLLTPDILFGPDNDYTRSVALGDFNGDGLLDITAGVDGGQSTIYLSQGVEQFPLTPGILFGNNANTIADIALGDLNGDGLLDIVTGVDGGQSAVYLNQGGSRFPSQGIPFGLDNAHTPSIALGDLNDDGLLDIIAGISGIDSIYGIRNGQSAVYLNQGVEQFPLIRGIPFGPDNDYTSSIAIGDLNGGSLLDIIEGNLVAFGGQSTIYLSQGVEQFPLTPGILFGNNANTIADIALGDLNGDGLLDIVTGVDGGQSAVYLNQGGSRFPSQGIPFGLDNAHTPSIALGDLNDDGLLDIIAGISGIDSIYGIRNGQSAVYLNQGGSRFPSQGISFGPDTNDTPSIALGDLNGDGLLDIVMGVDGGQSAIYLNQGGGRFPFQGIPFGLNTIDTKSVAVGDLNGDGLLDIATNTSVYLNPRLQSIALSSRQLPNAPNADFFSVSEVLNFPVIPMPYTLFDPQGNPVGRIEAQYSLNGGGSWRTAEPATITETLNLTTGYQVRAAISAAQGIPDVLGTRLVSRLFVSDTSMIANVEVWLALEHPRLSDLQIQLARPDGQLIELMRSVSADRRGRYYLSFDHEAVALISAGVISNTTRYQPLEALNRLSGMAMAGYWQLRITDRVSGAAGKLLGWGLRLDTPPAEHVFRWDTFKSGLLGRSDNVVIRLLAYPQAPAANTVAGTYFYKNAVAGPYLRPYVATTTFPFRVQGTQIRVVGDVGLEKAVASGLANAAAFRLIPGNTRNADEMRYGGGTLALSTADGYVPGGGQLAQGDNIAAIWPSTAITNTNVITQHTPTRRYLATTTETGNLPIKIPSNGSVASTLTISDVRRIGTFAITVGLTQTPTSTLAIALTAPDGTAIPLLESTAELASNVDNGLYNLTINPAGASAVPFLTDKPPQPSDTITLTLAPSATQQLRALQGTMINGDWTLQVTNPATNTTALLTGWGINSKLVPLYYGSAPITTTGLILTEVKTSGVQTLTISSTLPLLIFDLDVALEWDARKDTPFLQQLEDDLRSASDYLFDWTNGQVALGTITVYHDAKVRAMDYPDNPWLTADVRIYATNRLRPSAIKGGIVTEVFTDTVPIIPTQYAPGRIQIGSVWNRFGRSDSSLADDWPRTLAHELGHYLLFLDDNYIGLKNGLLQPVETCGGAMADHYRSDSTANYGEFLDRTAWEELNCKETFSQQRSQRADWETIKRFYPMLHTPDEDEEKGEPNKKDEANKNEGPRTQPLGITQITYASLPTEVTAAIEAITVDAPFYFLFESNDEDKRPVINDRDVRLFLLKAGKQWLVDLGRLQGGQINARGAQVYVNGTGSPTSLHDTLCAVRPTTGSYGCLPITTNGADELTLQSDPNWQPVIQVTPHTSITLQVDITGVKVDGQLHIQLFSPDFPAAKEVTLPVTSPVVSTIFTLTTPSLRGYVAVWSTNAQEEIEHFAVSDYALGGNPALQYIWANAYRRIAEDALQYLWANTNRYVDSPALQYIWANAFRYIQSGSLAYLDDNALQYVWANARQRSYAPASSNDGQVVLYSDEDFSAENGEFITLQTMSIITATPSYASLVGDTYRLAASKGMTLKNTSISIAYLTSEVNPSEEQYLRIYYLADGKAWEPLPSSRSPALNQVSAKVKGEGIYALMSSLELPLKQGWNLIGYPLAVSTTITSAVAFETITDSLVLTPTALPMIYGYDSSQERNQWRVYGPVGEDGDKGIVNTLKILEFGKGYQIYASQAMTLFVTGKAETTSSPNSTATTSFSNTQFLTPPSFFVAKLSSEPVLPDGVTVDAYVGDQRCSQDAVHSQVANDHKTVQIAIHVAVGDTKSCAAMGQAVDFALNLPGASYKATALLNNEQIQSLTFASASADQ